MKTEEEINARIAPLKGFIKRQNERREQRIQERLSAMRQTIHLWCSSCGPDDENRPFHLDPSMGINIRYGAEEVIYRCSGCNAGVLVQPAKEESK